MGFFQDERSNGKCCSFPEKENEADREEEEDILEIECTFTA
jgi:hypothetical protein